MTQQAGASADPSAAWVVTFNLKIQQAERGSRLDKYCMLLLQRSTSSRKHQPHPTTRTCGPWPALLIGLLLDLARATLQEPRCTRDSQLQGFHGHQCTWTTIRYDGPIVLQYTTTYTPSTSKYYVAGPCPFFLHLSTAMLNYSISTVDSKWVEHTWAAALFLLNFRGKWDWFCMGRGKEGKRSVHLCILRVLRSWSVTA